MNWNRKELKAKGKAAYRANRLMCIIAAILLMIASGSAGAGGSAIGSGASNYYSLDNSGTEVIDSDDYIDYDDDSVQLYLDDDQQIVFDEPDPDFPPVVIGIIIVVILIAMAIGIAVGAFLLNPLQVGVRKFFVDNAYDHSATMSQSNIGLAFSNNYMSVVKSMFTTGLFTFLWTLLFLIPGLIKAYEWRLVPYIVSEDPQISGKDARKKSSEMMNGSKWASFVLDLSFLGWILLGLLTLGILNLVFTRPYIATTDAELYLALSGRGDHGLN